MYHSYTSLRVRYAETDQMGYVYYGQYATYYEVARADCLRQLGMSYAVLEKSGIMLPVRESAFHYLKPALYDEVLQIASMIKEMPTIRIRFDHELKNEKQEVINRGHTILVFVNRHTGKPCRPPSALLTLIKPYFR